MSQKKMFAISVVLFLLIFSIPFMATSQLRIVCIGNSITQGKNEPRPDSSFEFSYRPWLWKKLIENGFAVDMVGFHPYFFGEKAGSICMEFTHNGIRFDRDCEAYYGITSTAFFNGSPSSGWTGKPLPKFSDRINDSVRGYTPDIALMHIGTNDADSIPALVGKTKENIREIISVLRAKNPFVTVFLAKLITGWKKINSEIEGLCIELSTEQSKIVMVDLTSGFINKPTDEGNMTYDYVHPNKRGQLFMMERWYHAITHNLQQDKAPLLNGKLNKRN